jgi:hypothetical protein
MKTGKHIDWEEVYTYHKEHPMVKKPPYEKKRRKHYKKRKSS